MTAGRIVSQKFRALLCGALLVLVSSCQKPDPLRNLEQDYSETTRQELLTLHKQGDVHASYHLGFNYFFNEDLSPKDNVSEGEHGLIYLQLAHDAGHPDAFSLLSTIYRFGLSDIAADPEKASAYDLEGAERGNIAGKMNYGVHNLLSSDAEIANRAHQFLIDIAADGTHGGVPNEYLAKLYYFGSEVYDADYESARLFAENCVVFQTSQGACEYLLARDYENGWGGPTDIERSANLFEVSARAGVAASMWKTGLNYLTGKGVEINEVTAFNWVKMAADQGNVDGQVSLGVMYALGQGTDIDMMAAFNAYEDAARQNSFHALRSLSTMYCVGEAQKIDLDLCAAGLILALENNDDQAPALLNRYFNVENMDDVDALKKKTAPMRATLISRYELKL